MTDRDVGYRRLLKSVMGAPTIRVTVGVRARQGADLVKYAAVNEFGSEDGHVPERSFLRSTVRNNWRKYAALLGKAGQRLILDGEDVDVAFGRVGIVVVADVQRTIRGRVPPPNAPSTIARKGSSTPLVDTGRLRQSIDHEVEVGPSSGAP